MNFVDIYIIHNNINSYTGYNKIRPSTIMTISFSGYTLIAWNFWKLSQMIIS